MIEYITLGITALFPAVLTIIFILLNKYTKFSNLSHNLKQVIYGVFFGILAILGTEWGIPINGAQMNTRDAAVLTAGLLFGSPAGIIAGLIGGVERYIAVYWGVGSFTRVACSLSTICAGFYSALLRKYIFDDKKPGVIFGLLIGLIMEVFHMTTVFITNMDDTNKAMAVVEACSLTMIVANSISVMISTFISKLLTNERRIKLDKLTITEKVQRYLLITILVAYLSTSVFMYRLQIAVANESVNTLLTSAISDSISEVESASNRNILSVTHKIAEEATPRNLSELSKKYNVAEISLIDEEGMIYACTNSEFLGFMMTSGDQAREFMCLVDDEDEYVQAYGPITYDESIYRKYAGVSLKSGFIQVGYDANEFQSDLAGNVENITATRRVGESGYIIIADINRNIVSAPSDKYYALLDDYGFGNDEPENEIFEADVLGVDSFCLYIETEGYYICSIIPLDEAYSDLEMVLYVNTFMEVLIFAVLFILVYLIIKRVILNNLNKVNKSLAKITGGDLDEIVNVNDNYEFASLSDDINKTVTTLKRYIAEASARIDAELEYAKNIQMSALPHEFPIDDRFEIFALMDPAKEVGGDFYDVYRTSDNTLNFLVADVSGKGIPGAMFMMRAKSVLHTLTEGGYPVNEVFTKGNIELCSGNDAGMFVTAWEGSIDLNTGVVKYACAGHNPPCVKHSDGTVEFIKGKPGFVLAGMNGIQYKMQELTLQKGDVLFLYTDGVTEATRPDKVLFGEERLKLALESMDSSVAMDYLCCEVIGQMGRFIEDAEQFDDITMVVLKYNG